MVGLLNSKPYEVFALKKRGEFTVSQTITNGKIRKQKSKYWRLLDKEDNILVDNILEQFEVPEYEFATKMISTALRHGAAIDFIVEQLNDSEGFITDYTKVIARQLKKYTNELTIKTKVNCPNCGELMRVEGGCATCHTCGYSACS